MLKPFTHSAYGHSALGIIVAIAALGASALSALANNTPPARVVELFTSQGCSSCPKANKFVAELNASDPNVLVLSYGVTYWDYLGWKDTFGDNRFTERQGQYRDALGTNMYTPQIVVNGAEDRPKFKKRQIDKHYLSTAVTLVPQGGQLRVMGQWPVGATIAVVNYTPGTQSVAVKRGENNGRTLTLANVVTDIDYHRWNGAAMSVPRPREGVAVLIHDPQTSAIIGAARYEANNR